MTGSLQRHIGVQDAVVVGLGAMLGAGVFAALGPAARAAGPGLLVGLVLAGLVAYCNATSSARLAARYPESGGTYVYGRHRLGPFWGYLAGWSFVVGKTASCAAMALTVAAYVWPEHLRAVAATSVVVLTVLSVSGVRRTTALTRVIVAVVLAVLAAVVIACATGSTDAGEHLHVLDDLDLHGVLQAAGLLFFAFAGYARIATLGEEVRDPQRTIPRAVTIALSTTLVVYVAVAVAALAAAGAPALGRSSSPLRTAVEAAGADWLAPVVRVGAALAALGALLALLLGVSRTTLAMARDRHLPRALATVTRDTPRHAEIAVGAAVLVLVLVLDVRASIAFSSFGVLAYYAVANASAWTLRRDEGRPPRLIPAVGLLGCAVQGQSVTCTPTPSWGTLAFSLPSTAVTGGLAVLAVGVLGYTVTRASRRRALGDDA